MRIGEVLLANGWVDRTGLTRAIDEQPQTGRRLCSLLIARGLLDHDLAARALAEQRGVPGVLLRHLEGRDTELASLIPAALGASAIALPIGRTRAGELVVCVRDPDAALLKAIQDRVQGPVVLAVTPATRIETLVASVYGPPPAGDGRPREYDVDLSTGPIRLSDVVDDLAHDPPAPHDPFDSPQLALVDLDDARVAKDHSLSGAFHLQPISLRPPTVAPAHVAPPNVTPSSGVPAVTTAASAPAAVSARTQLPAPPPTLDATLARLETAASRDAATELAMAYVAGRWTSSLLVTLRQGAALGHRGHGPTVTAVETIALPTSTPSMITIATETRRVTAEVPQTPIQDRLGKLLGNPQAPAAAPIVVATRAIGAIAVGDSVHGVGDAVDAASDLECLAEALGLAYARILLEAKKA